MPPDTIIPTQHPEFLMPDLPAGVIHLHRGIVLSARPAPPRLATSDRRVPDGSGLALGVMLSVAFLICLAVIVVAGWPVLHAGFGVIQGYAGVVGDVMRLVAL